MLVVQTDAYSTREWCQREVLWAKKYERPVLILHSAGDRAHSLAIRWREGVATMVSFPDQETLLAGLRRRRIIGDSPRVAADDEREAGCSE